MERHRGERGRSASLLGRPWASLHFVARDWHFRQWHDCWYCRRRYYGLRSPLVADPRTELGCVVDNCNLRHGRPPPPVTSPFCQNGEGGTDPARSRKICESRPACNALDSPLRIVLCAWRIMPSVKHSFACSLGPKWSRFTAPRPAARDFRRAIRFVKEQGRRSYAAEHR